MKISTPGTIYVVEFDEHDYDGHRDILYFTDNLGDARAQLHAHLKAQFTDRPDSEHHFFRTRDGKAVCWQEGSFDPHGRKVGFFRIYAAPMRSFSAYLRLGVDCINQEVDPDHVLPGPDTEKIETRKRPRNSPSSGVEVKSR